MNPPLKNTQEPAAVGFSFAQLTGRIIFYALLVVIALAAIPYGTAEPWSVSLFECAIFVLTILWLIEGLISKRWFLPSHRLLLPLLALTLFCFAQTLPVELVGREVAGVKIWRTISADPYQTKLVALKLLALSLTGAMLLRYTSNQHRLRALIYTLIGIGVASALFGIIRQTTQRGATGFILPYLQAGSGYGQFINKNHFAYLMEMVLGLALGVVAGRGVRREQMLIYLALALPVWTALVLSNSRGGLFAMLAQMLFLGFLFTSLQTARENSIGDTPTLMSRLSRSLILRAILLGSLVIFMFVGAVWMGGERLATSLGTVPDEMVSQEGTEGASRREIWQATWLLIKDHPVVGVGLGGYWTAVPQYHQASGQVTPQEAHNDYLELMASGGLIGVALFGWFLAVFIKGVQKRLREADGFARAASVGALVGLFGVAVHSFVDFGLHITINALVFVALLVIATGEVGEKGAEASARNARS